MKGSLDFRGLSAWLEDIAKAGADVDKVVTDVLTDAQPEVGGLMYHYLRATSETWTGAAAKTLFVSPVQQDGNYIFIELGANTGNDPAAWHKEYGTPRQAAEPWLRPTFTHLRRVFIKQKLMQVFERMGIKTA